MERVKAADLANPGAIPPTDGYCLQNSVVYVKYIDKVIASGRFTGLKLIILKTMRHYSNSHYDAHESYNRRLLEDMYVRHRINSAISAILHLPDPDSMQNEEALLRD